MYSPSDGSIWVQIMSYGFGVVGTETSTTTIIITKLRRWKTRTLSTSEYRFISHPSLDSRSWCSICTMHEPDSDRYCNRETLSLLNLHGSWDARGNAPEDLIFSGVQSLQGSTFPLGHYHFWGGLLKSYFQMESISKMVPHFPINLSYIVWMKMKSAVLSVIAF